MSRGAISPGERPPTAALASVRRASAGGSAPHGTASVPLHDCAPRPKGSTGFEWFCSVPPARAARRQGSASGLGATQLVMVKLAPTGAQPMAQSPAWIMALGRAALLFHERAVALLGDTQPGGHRTTVAVPP